MERGGGAPVSWLLLATACAASPERSLAVEPLPMPAALEVLHSSAGTTVADVRAALAQHPGGVGLTLARSARAWTADEIEALIHRSSEARNLRTLNVSGNPIGSAGAMAIAASLHLSALTALDLRGCRIGEAGARGLAYSEGLGALTRLWISAADPGPLGLAALRERYGDRLSAE